VRYHLAVRQIITRVDDDLHQKLHRKAAAEGRTMNSIVTEAIQEAVATHETPREAFRRRAEARGLHIVDVPPPSGPVPTWEELDAENRGVRIADLIEAERSES
jgi:hypothetical protein